MFPSDLLQQILLSVHLGLVKYISCSAQQWHLDLIWVWNVVWRFCLVSCRAGLGIIWSIDRINFLTGCLPRMQWRGEGRNGGKDKNGGKDRIGVRAGMEARTGCRKGALSMCHWVGTTSVCSATLPAVRAQHSRETAVSMLWHVTSMLSMEPQFFWEVLLLFLNMRCCSWGLLNDTLSIPKSGSDLTVEIAVHIEPALRFRFPGWEESLQPSIPPSSLLCFLGGRLREQCKQGRNTIGKFCEYRSIQVFKDVE